MTRNARLIAAKARAIGIEVPELIRIERTYAGHWQMSAGAWSWYAIDPSTGHEVMGSSHTIKELLAADAIDTHKVNGPTRTGTPDLYPIQKRATR